MPDTTMLPAGSILLTTMEVTVGTPELGITGERTVPGIPAENYWFRRHEAVYAALPHHVPRPPRRVLDAGSGEGYGVAAMAHLWDAAEVVGVDYDAAAVEHARGTYGSSRCSFVRGPLTSIPLQDNGFDLLVSLQVIEHIWTPGELLGELARVGRPGATVVVSTPNRLTFSPGLGRRERPANLFHTREYDAMELAGMVGETVEVDSVLGLHHGPRLAAWEAAHGSLPAAQLAGPPEGWEPALADLVAGVDVADFTLSGEALDASLDLVVVGRVR